tara:strand:- start:128 stop:553 length:426 start_codon:yes stop_codon:yes gene_type:complete
LAKLRFANHRRAQVMSTKYQNSADVPLDVIIARLKELSDAVAGGRESQGREFTMRIPAECDRDADLVIGEAARRLEQAQTRVAELEKCVDDGSDAWLLRKQAEAVEDMWDKVNPDNPGRSLKNEAQRLRSEADDIERGGDQ